MRHTPKLRLTKHSETPNQTVWLADWVYPPMSGKWGKCYWVTTYPDSDLIFLQTGAKKRPVSQSVATKITAQIKSALALVSANV